MARLEGDTGSRECLITNQMVTIELKRREQMWHITGMANKEFHFCLETGCHLTFPPKHFSISSFIFLSFLKILIAFLG